MKTTELDYSLLVKDELSECTQIMQTACLHNLFEDQVGRTPNRIAIHSTNEAISYSQLNHFSERIEHKLKEKGLCPGDTVAIYLERGPSFIAAILGVLKGQGVILPIDPLYPKKYISGIIDSVQPKLVLTDLSLCTIEQSIPRINIDELRFEFELNKTTGPDHKSSTIDDPAYILYTSGTQGRPKGIVGTHKPVSHFLEWYKSEFPDRGESFSFCAGLGHDPMLRDIFVPLTTGATLHVPPSELLLSSGFVDWLIRREITTLHLTPQLGRLIASACEEASKILEAMRYLFFGGDTLDISLVGRINHICPQAKVVNFYGTTETPQAMLAYLIPRDFSGNKVPIGRPIDGVQITLDKVHPEEREGEILVHTEYLSEGYFADPDLTGQKYSSGNQEKVRTYRTGDIARERHDGTLVFVGRRDSQVKIRGHRVDLEGVRQTLLIHPDVEDAHLTILRQDGVEGLVGYYKLQHSTKISSEQISNYLAERLPDCMIPSTWVEVESFHLTPSGKIDRECLPHPVRPRTRKEQSGYTFETELLEIWRQVLRRPDIGIHDGFFDFGGDSLMGIELVGRVQNLVGEIVYILTLYEAPTVARFAKRLIELHPETIWEKYKVAPAAQKHDPLINAAKIIRFKQLCCPEPATDMSIDPKLPQEKPRASFVLGAPRSGTTLLRVILNGHPKLFSPPALYMLQFQSLRQRSETFQAEYSFWKEGALSALMHAGDGSFGAASLHMKTMEDEDYSVPDFYNELNRMLGNRHLIDKTANYAISLSLLQSMERIFHKPRYIYLARHPGAAIYSFGKSSLDQLFYSRLPHLRELDPKPFTARELAELVWLNSNSNIQEFLSMIPDDRKRTIRYEDLVKDPGAVIADVCSLLEIDYGSEMLRVYDDSNTRMTQGPGKSIMAGDPKFHQHKSISQSSIDTWRNYINEDQISQATWELADNLGYQRSYQRSSQTEQINNAIPLARVNEDCETIPLFCVYGLFLYRSLAEALGPDQPTYGIYIDEEASLLRGEQSDPSNLSISTLARCYIEEIRKVQQHGPYQIIGISFAGVVAFEIAKLLMEGGDEVHSLILLDSRATISPRFQFLLPPFNWLKRRLKPVSKTKELTSGNSDDRLSYSDTELKQKMDNMRKRIRRLARADWKPNPLKVDVVLVRAEHHVWSRFVDESDLGWGRLVKGEIKQYRLPGSHLGILNRPLVFELAKILRFHLLPTG